jgi:signal transduction histidine kinase
VAGLETRVDVKIISGPELTLMVDADQIEQMLINLVRNAAEAALEGQLPEKQNGSQPASNVEPEVTVGWKLAGNDVVLTIEDNGPGLANPSNAFVPFYTTKPSGSGIGLVLSRQVAEAHRGTVELTNPDNQRGCMVKVTLPLH